MVKGDFQAVPPPPWYRCRFANRSWRGAAVVAVVATFVVLLLSILLSVFVDVAFVGT